MNRKTFHFATAFIFAALLHASPSNAWSIPEKPVANSALVLDLEEDGIGTAALNAEGSVYFNWDVDDFAEATSWLNVKDGFLVIDRNENGYIDGGTELFGNNSGTNGFDSLREFDSNGDGKISAADKNWKDLYIWTDSDEDGFSDYSEKHTLDSLHITEINISHTTEVDYTSSSQIRRQSYFLRQDGRKSLIREIEFKTDWQNTKAANLDTNALPRLHHTITAVPDMRGYGLLRRFSYEIVFQDTAPQPTAFLESLEKLKNLKEGEVFTSNTNIMDLVEEIMYQWADVEHADPKEGFTKEELRKIAFLEKWRGQSYLKEDLENFQKKNGYVLQRIFTKTHSHIYAQTISQTTAGKSLFGETDYMVDADEFRPARKVDFDKIKELGKFSLSYTDHKSRKIFWQNVIRLIEYGIGIDNLKPVEARLLDKTIQRSDPYLNLTGIVRSLIPTE